MYRKKVHVHFIGIGGVGMSAIAHVLKNQGYIVSGCDLDITQHSVKQLQQLGCVIYAGNNSTACDDASIDIVVYSSAIKKNDAEITRAQTRGIPTISRALMLAELMRTKYSIAISGAHGKTTTTSIISHILIEGNYDPTVIIGGHLKNISANARWGLGDFLVAEADESDRSLLSLHATLAVVTNIDLEHLETYRDIDDIKQTFKQFLYNLPFYGKAVLCVDDSNIRSLLPLPHIKIIKYGIDYPADIWASDIVLEKTYSQCTIHAYNQTLGAVRIAMPGRHNILNTLAAIAITLDLEVPFTIIQEACANFKGVDRRFSFKGSFNGADIFDDYGHHPVEIKNTIDVARKRCANKLIVVFQPHRYTRTEKLWEQFVEMFATAPIDHLIVTDIYAASEEPIPQITSQNFVAALQRRVAHNFTISYAPMNDNFGIIKDQLQTITNPGDLVLLQGAGKINRLATQLCEQ